MGWLVVISLIALLIILLKVKRFQHKIYVGAVIILLIFFYTTGSKLIAENNVDIKTFDGMVTASKLYIRWLGNAVNNAKTIVGNAIRMDWQGG